jgi:hypothetical protein
MRREPLPCTILALCLLLPSVPLAAPTAPELEDTAGLLWVERETRSDLGRLLEAGLSVRLEVEGGLFVDGRRSDLAWLAENGFRVEILDPDPTGADHVVVGLRPDSDTGALLRLGPVLFEHANWWLLRLPRGASLEPLGAARVFATRLPHESMLPAKPGPWAGTSDPGDGPDGPEASQPDPLVQKIVAAVTDADIDTYWNDLVNNPPTGTRYSTAQGCDDAAVYCHDTYVGLGLDAEYQTYNPAHAPNVIGKIEGAIRPDDVYIAIAHLDDLPSSGPAPGADDNASGSVVVLESADVMSCWSFRNTVKFLNVTGEEVGLLGSEAYAADAQARGENILGVINMDMPGWEGDGMPDPENLDVSYNGTSQWLGERFADSATTYGTGLVVDAFYCPSLTASDHWPFWQRGWSAIIGITDNEGYCGHGGNYPDYHTSDDTIANCGDPAFFYSVVRTSVATLAELAGPFKIAPAQSAFACGAPVELVVGDRDLDTDPGSVESVQVSVWSDSETTPETVTLSERSASSAIFSGTVPTTSGPPVPGDGVLSVAAGDTVHAEYVDALDCDGATTVPYAATATIDCTGALISNVSETGVSDVEATITWTTDEAADSLVRWGDTSPPGTTEADGALVTSHSVTLGGLQPCTVYYYEVESTDVAGNTTRDDNGGNFYRFETLGDFGSGLQPCHAGQVTVDAPVYSCADTAVVEVTDLDLNLDPLVAETVTLFVTSSTETAPEPLVAVETGVNTSVFTGSLGTSSGAPVADGVLQVADGDVVTATYRDADDGTGVPADTFATALADCAGPAISNVRVESITHARATIRWDTAEDADTVVEWGPTTALGTLVSSSTPTTSHAVTLTDLDLCDTFWFEVRSTDTHGNLTVANDGGGPFSLHSFDIPGLYGLQTFEGDTSGWTLEGEWEVGEPGGIGGSSGPSDPATAYNNKRVLGHDLTGLGLFGGDYEPAAAESARSPVLDGSTWTATRLLFQRRLNAGPGDPASLWLHTDGVGRPLFNTAGSTFTESGFQTVSLDIGAFADGAATVQLEFRQVAGSTGQYSGWNVDDVIFKNGTLPDYAACMDCSAPPSFPGATSAVDNDACGADGVTVSWEPAVTWGSGGSGTYSVYRDPSAGFTPSPANRIATGVSGSSYVDASAPQDVQLYYLVRSENDETCGAGPNNGGLTDANERRVAVLESTSRPAAAEVADLRVDLVNHAHVRLSWASAGDATSYRIYRSPTPLAVDFVAVAETGGTVWEDASQGANANGYFYLVRGLNACGDEGP